MGGTILFVCTGNFCRSPMAEAILQDLLQQDGKEKLYEVRSVGTWTRNGLSASLPALQATKELGLDISAHRSHHLTSQDIEEANLILVMTRDHKEALDVEFPQARAKTYLLSEMTDNRYDIDDPAGSGAPEAHYICAQEIEKLLKKGYSRILELVAGDVDET
jgi:protein-tyrosine-phosphatase